MENEYSVRVTYLGAGGCESLNVQGAVPPDQLRLLCHGLSLDGQALRPAQVSWQDPGQLRFVLKEGKNARFAACVSRSVCSSVA